MADAGLPGFDDRDRGAGRLKPVHGPAWDGADRQAIRQALLDWFRRHQRVLPWRDQRTAYRVWVSEIMLQQTQVEAVRPYFERFVARFPTLEALATASVEEVIYAWAGLGYYGRARNLHSAARHVLSHYDGVIPASVEELQLLPGIGRYTAGAIASLAYDRPAPILDGNVMRVLCRLLEIHGDPRAEPANSRLWSAADELVQGLEPGTLNESLMELGAIVCIPGVPRCSLCPVQAWCCAFAHSTQTTLPERRPAPSVEDRSHIALVVRHGSEVLLEYREAGRIWRGFWVFPTDFPSAKGDEAPEAAARKLASELGPVELQWVGRVKHGVMNWRITLNVFEGTPREGVYQRFQQSPHYRWVPVSSLDDYPLPSPHQKIARLFTGSEDQLALIE